MSSITLVQLQRMKRSELQSLSKENSLKANGKTEVLLEALIQHLNLTPPVEHESVVPVIQNQQTTTTTTKKSINIPTSSRKYPAHRNEFEDDSEDEMMLGGGTIQTVKAVVKKGKGVASYALNRPSSSSNTEDLGASSTKAMVDQLIKTVKTLQSDLLSVRTAHSELLDTVTSLPNQSHSISQADIGILIDEKLQAHRLEVTRALSDQHREFVYKVDALKSSNETLYRNLEAKVEDLKNSVEEDIESVQLQGLALAMSASVTAQANLLRVDNLDSHINSLSSATKPRPRISSIYKASTSKKASPTLSDAPPVQSLTSFSSPPESIHNATNFADRSEVNLSPTATGRTSSIFRSPAKKASSSTSKILFHQDIVPPRSAAKHSRYSEISNESDVSAGTPTMMGGNRVDLAVGQGQKKKARVSEVSSVGVEENSRLFEDEDEDEEEDDSFKPEDASFNNRDTIVLTKSGNEPTPLSAISTSDPSYFSAPSASASIQAPSSIRSPFKPRKSLPMQSLPFSIAAASPYLINKSNRPSSSATPFGNMSNFNGFAGTPMAAKTLFGGEYADSRFGDVAEDSPNKPWKNSASTSGSNRTTGFSFEN